MTRDVHWSVTVFYQQIENSNIANQIHGFTTDYSKFILISIITSSQVNASLCSLQYALNEQLTSTKSSHPWFSQNRRQTLGTGTPKNIIFFQNTDSRFLQTK